MATRRYKINPGERDLDIVEEVGAATNSKMIELTVDLASSIPASGGLFRKLTADEVLVALTLIRDHILNGNWPPA